MQKRFQEEQILTILREVEKAEKKDEAYRKFGITEQTYYRWKQKYQGTNVNKMKQLRDLEKENNKLRKLVSEYAIANQAMKELLQKKRWA